MAVAFLEGRTIEVFEAVTHGRWVTPAPAGSPAETLLGLVGCGPGDDLADGTLLLLVRIALFAGVDVVIRPGRPPAGGDDDEGEGVSRA